MNWLSYLLGAKVKPQRHTIGISAEESARDVMTCYYQQHIAPLARRFENLRVAKLKRARSRFYLALFICTLLFFVYWLFSAYIFTSQTLLLTLGPFLLLALGLAWWSFRPVLQFKSEVKAKVFPKIFGYFGDDFIYSQTHHMSLTHLKRSKILPSYDTAKFDEYVQGSFQGVSIALNELELFSRVKSKKRSSLKVQFKGIAIELGCQKRFKGHTIVVSRRMDLQSLIFDRFKGLERVKLEDPRFEKRFDAFSNDQVEARYLLTLGFMERLQSLANRFSGKLECAFYQDKLLILLESNHNRFELGSIFSGASFEYEFSQIHKEMQQVFAMIEILKLNEYTGL